jgi:hypothetical protein
LTAFEKLRANIPLWRAAATSVTIILSVVWMTWQGSAWVADIRNEMREMRTSLMTVTKSLDDKAASKDVEHRFELMCARAPARDKVWVCGTTVNRSKG